MRVKTQIRKGLSLIEIAVVMLVIGLMMALSLNLLRSASLFQTSEGEAKKLASQLVFARNTAVLSNELVYFELNLDKEEYRAYRVLNINGKVKKKNFLRSTKLSDQNSLQAVASALGNKRSEGIVNIRFLPSGLGDEVAIYIGPKDGSIEATIIYSRYKAKATVYKEEIEIDLRDPTWEELDVIE